MITRELYEKVSELTQSVDGVSSMSETFSDSLKYIPGLGRPVKGIHISEDEGALTIDLYVNVYFRTKIPQLAWDIQSTLKKALKHEIEESIQEINVHVQNVEPIKQDEQEE